MWWLHCHTVKNRPHITVERAYTDVASFRSIGLFALLAVFWGTTYVAIEVGLETLPPLWFVALRFDIAAVVLLGYVLLRSTQPLPQTRGDWTAVAISAFFIIGVNNALLFVGQQYTTSGIAAIVYSLVPITTAASVALLLERGRIDTVGLIGIAVGLVGVGLVAQPDPNNLTGGVTFGVGLISIAVVSISIGSVLLRRVETATPSVTITAWGLLGAAIGVHLVSGVFEATAVNPLHDPLAVIALVYLGIFPSAIAYSIYFTLLNELGPFEINLVSYVVPIIATIAGWLLLGESITATTVLGFLTIFFGFVLLKRKQIADSVANW